MLDNRNIRKPIPYYGSYAGFYRAMWALKSNGLPRVIETRVFAGKNLDAEASRIVAGLAALGWTDEAGRPDDELRKLVHTFGTEAFGDAVAEVLPQSYPFLQDFDLESGTSDQLSEVFVSYLGRDAPSLRNAETFYLCLAAEAGLPMAERLSRRAVRGVGDARKWLKQAQSGALEDDPGDFDPGEEPSREKGRPLKESESLTAKVVELLGLLMSRPDGTPEHKMLANALLTYLERQLKH